MRILTVNATSGSYQLSLVEDTTLVRTRRLSPGRAPLVAADVAAFLDGEHVDVVGHRISHGGNRHRTASRLDQATTDYLRDLCGVEPLRQARCLDGVDVVREVLPHTATVGCYDTAFHAGLPEEASAYALPREWRERWNLKRFGFHGLTHAWASRRAAHLLDVPLADLRLVVCHLGTAVSLCGVRDGSSVDTTMGFSPLEGPVMSTRSGSLDPALVLWLLGRTGLDPEGLRTVLDHESGLLALAGTADVRTLVEQATAGEHRAVLALDVYVHQVAAGVAAMTAATGGLDALVLTGGVGTGSPVVRARVAERLRFLGVELDPALNRASGGDTAVGAAGAAVATLVVESREDLEIARDVRRLMTLVVAEA